MKYGNAGVITTIVAEPHQNDGGGGTNSLQWRPAKMVAVMVSQGEIRFHFRLPACLWSEREGWEVASRHNAPERRIQHRGLSRGG